MTDEIVLRHLPLAFPLEERERDREGYLVVSVTGSGAFWEPGDLIVRRQVNALRRNGWIVRVEA